MRRADQGSRATIPLLLVILGVACGDGSDEARRRSQAIPRIDGPESVPKELVASLLAGRVALGGSVPEIIVGRVPGNLPFEVPSPRNARVLGGVAQRSAGTLVFAVAQSPYDAVRDYAAILGSAGWEKTGGGYGGFNPSEIARSGWFCRGETQSISAWAAERREGGSILQVSYADHESHSPCDARQRENRSPLGGPIPTFRPPRGASILHADGGGGRYHREARARVKTRLSPTELVTHYGAQLRADGWSLESEAAGSGVGAQTWHLRDRDGRSWTGLLLALAIPDSDDREVLFRVVPQKPAPDT